MKLYFPFVALGVLCPLSSMNIVLASNLSTKAVDNRHLRRQLAVTYVGDCRMSGSCCTGTDACKELDFDNDSTIVIGTDSCKEYSSCGKMGYHNSDITIGTNTCIGYQACLNMHSLDSSKKLTVVIGDDSCNLSTSSCQNWATNGGNATVGNGSCQGSSACNHLIRNTYGIPTATVIVGDRSCLGHSSCELVGRDRYSHIGNDSCIGKTACAGYGMKASSMEIGNGSCQGESACYLTTQQEDPIKIGSESCNCKNCCKCLEGQDKVPDGKCNSLGTSSDNCCESASERNANFDFSSSETLTLADSITTPLVSETVPWVVGNATFDVALGNAFNETLMIHHTVGNGPDRVVVALYQYNCEEFPTGSDLTLVTLSKQTYDKEADQLLYNVDVDKALINDSSMVEFQSGAGSSIGAVKFCTEVTTVLDGAFGASDLIVSFRKTNFALNFNLTDNSFSGGSFGVQADTIVDVNVDVEVEYDVTVCQCSNDSFDCVDSDSVAPISQDENVAICLETNSPEVVISNFNLRMANGDNTYMYEPVIMGNGQWAVNSNLLTTVVGDGSKLRIETFVVTGIFSNNGDGNTVSISGNAYLEFVSSKKTTGKAKDSLASFGFDMELEDKEMDVGVGGCLNTIINVVTSFFG